MNPHFPEEVAYLGGLLRKSRLVETKGSYEIHIQHEREFLENVDSVLKHKLEGKYKIEGNRLAVHSAELFDVLLQFFGHPDADRKWALTSYVKHASDEHKAAFLRGLFDAMGTIEGAAVLKYRWHAADLQEIKALLADLEISSVVKIFELSVRNTSNSESSKKNELHVRDVASFASRVGTIRPAHQQRLVAVLAG